MKRLVLLLALLVVPAVALAQTFDQDLELLRSDLRAEKVAFITENMALNDADGAKFWPIQREYQGELSKLEDQRIALIKQYVASSDTMSAKMATDLMGKAFKLQDQRTTLLKKYADKVSKAVSPKIAMRFVHVESALESLLNLQIRGNLPVVQ
ncbi:MAG: hypothetical protein ACHQ52_08570 [Candidatus Eisenbacteria bacterium]